MKKIFAGYFVFQKLSAANSFRDKLLNWFCDGKLLIGRQSLESIYIERNIDWKDGFYSFKFFYALGSDIIDESTECTVFAWSQPVLNGAQRRMPVRFRIANI